MHRLLFSLTLAAMLASAPALADDAGHAATSDDTACPAAPFAMGVRFQAKSAEIDALRYQAYNVATRQLDALLAARDASDDAARPPAIVLDLDETVLDNSPMAATGVVDCIDYTHWGDLWQRWVEAASAPLIPGARAFLEHADARDVAIYYVSNRSTANLDATVQNLKRHDLPQASADHVRLMGPPKPERRAAIARDHDILMLVGDSLHDFDGVFADASLADQRAAVKRLKKAFGRRFIILPNASYGSWQNARLSVTPALSK